MKKVIILFVLIVMLSSAGCSDANDTVVHRDGNLIITNYSDREITDTTITHGGATIAASPKAMKDTQICYFTIEPADDFSYTVSFVDDNGRFRRKIETSRWFFSPMHYIRILQFMIIWRLV